MAPLSLSPSNFPRAELIWNRLNLVRTGDGSSLMMVRSSCRTFYISSIIGQTDIRQGQIFFRLRLRFLEILDLIIVDHCCSSKYFPFPQIHETYLYSFWFLIWKQNRGERQPPGKMTRHFKSYHIYLILTSLRLNPNNKQQRGIFSVLM